MSGRHAVIALQFLTRLPVSGVRVDDGDLRHAAAFFPAVGALVALIGVATR